MKRSLSLTALAIALSLVAVLLSLSVVASLATSDASAFSAAPSNEASAQSIALTGLPKQPVLKDIPLALRLKIEPQVLRELVDLSPPGYSPHGQAPPGQTTYIVYLREQADLRGVRRIDDLTLRRGAVMATLQATANRAQRDVLAYLDRQRAEGQVSDYLSFWIFNGLAVTGDLETLLDLAARPDVAMIRANHLRQPPAPVSREGIVRPQQRGVEWNIARVGADRVWRETGITGRGVVVANMDTGVAWEHPALQPRYRGATGGTVDHNYNWFDPTKTYPKAPGDGDGHGTLTMGVMVGSAPEDVPGSGRAYTGRGASGELHIGMAPDAQWIAVKIFPDFAPTTDVIIHQAFQWILAPTDLNGENPDPSKAPDIVNNSWGSVNGADTTFQQDLAAWRAAGIVGVFAAGNNGGLGEGSGDSPGSFPDALAVGATDFDNKVASFSGRGPSFWEEIKPEVSAPGVDIRSSFPDGTYLGGVSGTSFSAPHVAGLAALMLQANPRLDSGDLAALMQATALDLADPGVDNDSGAGLIDAYHAVRWAQGAGRLYGTVSDARTGRAIGGAEVVGVRPYGGGEVDRFWGTTDSSGLYEIAAPGGVYTVTISAFGYVTATVKGIDVIAGFRSVQDFALEPTASGTVTGTVRDADTGAPLEATVSVVGTELETQTDAEGFYTLAVPVGRHQLRATSDGHVASVSPPLTVTKDSTTVHDFVLRSSPKILLVDADAWTGLYVENYYRWSLDYLGYPYETWHVSSDDSTNVSIPDVELLSSFDLVIWAQSQTSPGYIGAADELIGYLDSGGRLLISGPEIGYFDGLNGYAPDFYYNYLHAQFVREPAAATGLEAVSGEVFDGISLNLYDVYALKLPYPTPDVVAPTDVLAASVLEFSPGSSGGLVYGECGESAYRVVYLSFGYESSGPRPDYAEVLSRGIDWLGATSPEVGLRLVLAPQVGNSDPGTWTSYYGTVANIGTVTDTYRLSISGHAWPTAVLDPSLIQPLTSTAALPACGWETFAISVTVPADVEIDAEDVATLDIASSVDPSLSVSRSLTTRAFPAWQFENPMSTSRYWMGTAGVGCRAYAIGGYDASGGVSDLNESYDPGTGVWTQHADKPTPAANCGAAALDGLIYVPGGWGRMSTELSVVEVYDPDQDAWHNVAPLPVRLAGMATASLDPSTPNGSRGDSDRRSGQRGKLYVVGGWDGRDFVDRLFEYDPVTDAWTEKAPMPGGPRANPGAVGLEGKLYVVGGYPSIEWLEIYDPATDSWTSGAPLPIGRQGLGMVVVDGLIYAVGGGQMFEGLTAVDRYDPVTDSWTSVASLNSARAGLGATYVGGTIHAVGGMSSISGPSAVAEALTLNASLCASAKTVEPAQVLPGERLTYTITLRNPHRRRAFSSVALTDALPAGTVYVPESATGGARYITPTEQIRWTGSISPASSITLTYQVSTTAPLLGGHGVRSGGSQVINRALVDAGGGERFVKSAHATVLAPNLTSLDKRASRTVAASGDTITYTIGLTNTGLVTATDVLMVDPLPEGTLYITGSATAGAHYNTELKQIEWQGEVAGAPLAMGYTVRDSGQPGGPGFTWQDISGTGTELTTGSDLDDGFLGPVDIGFSFPFYSQEFSDLYVGSNGYLSFGQGYRDIPFASLPSEVPPNNDIVPFGGDMYITGGTTQIYYQTLSAPPRFVLQWVDLDHFGFERGNLSTFQVILYPEGDIKVQYDQMMGSAMAAGIENEDGTEGVNYDPFRIYSGLAVLYEAPSPPPPVPSISFQARVQDGLPPETVLQNQVTVTYGGGLVATKEVTTVVNTVDLTTSSLSASRDLIVPGDVVVYHVTLHNRGTGPAAIDFVDPIPEGTAYLTGSATGGVQFDAGDQAMKWTGVINAAESRRLDFAVRSDADLDDGAVILNAATIDDGIHAPIELVAKTTVRLPDIQDSELSVSADTAELDEEVVFTVRVKNAGAGPARARLVGDLAPELVYVPGSGAAGTGTLTYDDATQQVRWEGTVPAEGLVHVQFSAAVVVEGVVSDHRFTLEDGLGPGKEWVIRMVILPYRVYFPSLPVR